MSSPVSDKIDTFLRPLIASKQPYSHRPFVTLTYAQSLDGKIAGPDGQQVQISGRESSELTHRLRSMHSGIMVGIETVLNDDPQLTARFVPNPSEVSQPIPVILDARCRFPLSSRLMKNYKAGVGKRPWIVCDSGMSLAKRRIELEDAGCRILVMPTKGTGRFDLLPLLDRLNTSMITHLMIEGGARVISSFLNTPKNTLDLVVVTVAPVLIGKGGVEIVNENSTPSPELLSLGTETFGKDVVFACKVRHRDWKFS
ncbi:RIB7, arfC [Phaffia rhodozyma]|uniref:2,5-diamino-6-ribosylamino-4(3H)-pyrimidinone 5'-phosphate reductase n=1 Tax=Phaffia rhodozyma TaxID=264483 RepID=A0A0F7SWN3_PHARH|nr:RIB7, arfC [Phaffia rhodozyma]